jgi:arylsulfatase
MSCLFRILAMAAAVLCVLPQPATAAKNPPNILLILADDLGFSDIGSYGGEIPTPNLDALAKSGIRFNQFYNGARCCPSRAILMTGLYPHQAHVGDMVDEYARKVREKLNTPAYSDRLNPHAPTIAEALKNAGYRTGMSGKWHLGYRPNEWPAARGFDRAFGVIEGAMNYYGFGMQHTGVITNPPMALDHEVFIPPREGFFATHAFTGFAVKFIQESAQQPKPFFLYLAYTAPHWPLHASPEAIAKYRGSYKRIGWDNLREQRLRRLKDAGLIDPGFQLVPRPANVRPWTEATPERQDQWDEEMAVYAAMLEEMDRGIGQVLDAIGKTGRAENTVVMFMSDNGGAAEDPNRSLPGSVLGTRESYEGYGIGGAHVSSGPFRKTKKYSHEGGISTPLIISWPAGITGKAQGAIVRDPAHFIDIMPTCLDLAGAKFPSELNGHKTLRPEGISLKRSFNLKPLARRGPIFWEHEGHRAVRDGKWKLVASHNDPWELYDMEKDRSESNDLAKVQESKTRELIKLYDGWAKRAGVKPWPGP